MVLRSHVKGCRRNSTDDSQHSFFSLPKDIKTRQKWLQFLGKRDGASVRICGDHFDPKTIRKKFPRPLLVRNAVPTRSGVCHETSQRKSQPQKLIEDNHGESTAQQESRSPPRTQIININANNVSQIIISDETLDIATISALPSVSVGTSSSCIETVRVDSQSPLTNATLGDNEPPHIRERTPTPNEAGISVCSTPTRKKVQNQLIITPKTMRLNAQKRTIAALRSKINRFKLRRVKQTGTRRVDELIAESATYLSTEAHTLLATQLRLAKGSKFRNRFDKTFKDIALSIFYHSPKAYKFLRKIITLPSVKVLRAYQRQFSIYPGINTAVLAQLKDQFAHAEPKDKVVSLLFDEIMLSEELHFDPSIDEFVGLQDDGKDRKPVLAAAALVGMITWINKSVKQVVGHWFLAAKGTSEKTHEIISDTIQQINDTGLIVKVIIFDQGPKNRGFLKKVDVSLEKPFFEVNGHKLYVMYDPPHLLKSVRNNIKSRVLCYKGGMVEWSKMRTVFNLSRKTNLNLIPKITDRHFELNDSKMRVSLAAQVLSESMYTAYLVYTTMFPNEFCQKSSDEHACTDKCLTDDRTGQFILDMDKLFDSLNSTLLNPTVPNKLNYAIAANTPHYTFLQDIAKNIRDSKFTERSRPPCLDGIILTINSVLLLAKELQDEYAIPKLCTRRLNQDGLENLFAVIRQQHGCNVDPSPKQFQAGMRHIYITHLSKLSKASNCEADENQIFAKLSKINLTSPPKPIENLHIQIPNEDDIDGDLKSEVETFTEDNAIYYIAGYLCKKYLSHHACEKCEQILINREDDSFEDYKLFTIMKQYAVENGLLHAREQVFKILKEWEKQFALVIESILHVRNITKALAAIIQQMCPMIELCTPEATASFLGIFLRIRCHWQSRFVRRKINSRKHHTRNSRLKRYPGQPSVKI